MKELNIWNINAVNCESFSTIEEVVEAIKNGKIKTLSIRSKFTPGDSITNMFENFAEQKDCIVNYVDANHLVTLSDFTGTHIDKDFFEKNKDLIAKAFLYNIQNNQSSFYHVYDYYFSDELLDYLLSLGDIMITFEGVDLTEEQINKIKSKHIDAYIIGEGIDDRKQISSRFAIGYTTFKELETKNNISIGLNELDNVDFDNFTYLKETSVIYISNFFSKKDELEYLAKVKTFIEKLDKLNRKYLVKFSVNKRSNFTKVFGDYKASNIDFVIENDLYSYSYKEYMEEEDILNQMVEPIKEANLSPLEKYFAVYNIVKKFKKYKENPDDLNSSRYLRYILKNEYIVCVGFSKLLATLCDKVGIDCKSLDVDVDISYDNGFTEEEIKVERGGHARNILSIDDDKYNVHGLYVSDSTWDNSLTENLLNNALLTFDKMRVSKRMFFYSFSSPILDIHNFQEFNEQVNFLLDRQKRNFLKMHAGKFDQKKDTLSIYESVIEDILDTIKCDPKSNYFVDLLEKCEDEADYIILLTELGNYLLTRVNQKVDEDIIIKASLEADKVIGNRRLNNNSELPDEKVIQIPNDIEISQSSKEEILQRYDSSLPKEARNSISSRIDRAKELYQERDLESFPYEDIGADHDLIARTR